MEDTDWRPSSCPNCGATREARRNPICKNSDCKTKPRRQQLSDLLRRPYGNLTQGEKEEIAELLDITL